VVFSIIDSTETLPRIQRRVSNALAAESCQLRGVSGVQEKCFSVVDEHNAWVGSVTGYTLYGSLVIDMLWIEKGYRRVGHGRELVKKIEEWGQSQGAAFAKVSTMEWWESTPFYESMGYEVIFIDDGYDKETKQYTLKKKF
jgi:GNAT superfamily N-acetyltransferase